MKVHQRDALRGQAIDVRRTDERIARYAEFAEALVVGEDDNDVGL